MAAPTPDSYPRLAGLGVPDCDGFLTGSAELACSKSLALLFHGHSARACVENPAVSQ